MLNIIWSYRYILYLVQTQIPIYASWICRKHLSSVFAPACGKEQAGAEGAKKEHMPVTDLPLPVTDYQRRQLTCN